MSHVIVLWAVCKSAQIDLFALRQLVNSAQTDIQLSMSASNKRSLSGESEDEYSASSSSAPPKKRVSKSITSSENKENENDASNIVKMKQKDLEKASKEDLVGYVLALQKLVGKGGAAGGAALSPEKIAEKVEVRERDYCTRRLAHS